MTTSEAAATAPLLYEEKGQVAWLTLNRPGALNSLNLDIIHLMAEHLEKVVADEGIRVLVITAAGKAFCTGADLGTIIGEAHAEPGEKNFFDYARPVFDLLRNFPKPVIAALNGATMAGGLELALTADIIIASDRAKIGDGHANFGVFPGGGGASILPRRIPVNVANLLLFTGRTLPAEKFVAYGLVNEVVPANELVDSTQALAEEIAGKSPLALRRMKEVVRTARDSDQADALRHEYIELLNQLRSFDLTEGLKAFAEKRAPQFQGY